MAWLIHHPFSSFLYVKVRALSCVGMLASCGEAKQPGYLWLVDATGVYRVRAHAVGGGPLAATVNERLETMDVSSLNREEASQEIVEFLSNLKELSAESRVEIATVGCDESSGKRRMQRLFSSRLFGIGQQ
jgi:20S proteasome alpha/beta subunit